MPTAEWRRDVYEYLESEVLTEEGTDRIIEVLGRSARDALDDIEIDLPFPLSLIKGFIKGKVIDFLVRWLDDKLPDVLLDALEPLIVGDADG